MMYPIAKSLTQVDSDSGLLKTGDAAGVTITQTLNLYNKRLSGVAEYVWILLVNHTHTPKKTISTISPSNLLFDSE